MPCCQGTEGKSRPWHDRDITKNSYGSNENQRYNLVNYFRISFSSSAVIIFRLCVVDGHGSVSRHGNYGWSRRDAPCPPFRNDTSCYTHSLVLPLEQLLYLVLFTWWSNHYCLLLFVFLLLARFLLRHYDCATWTWCCRKWRIILDHPILVVLVCWLRKFLRLQPRRIVLPAPFFKVILCWACKGRNFQIWLYCLLKEQDTIDALRRGWCEPTNNAATPTSKLVVVIAFSCSFSCW